ncbi:MAG: alanine--glyoxylate aminotransferase family protein [Verrucomicrobium sp.]|nr:alanine--glyoxylate aminotransferase family protein [Verrucomicrobium sp.]
MSHVKLFIPGPIEVSAKTREAYASPAIGHRSGDFQKLYAAVQPGLQSLFGTTRPVYVSTSSAWGVMEGALRNLVKKKVLNCMNGAFSDKWLDVSQRCGKAAEALQVEWGSPIRGEAVEAKLKTGEFDAVTIIHNETSTGTMSPILELAEVAKRFPDVSFIVDCVSSLSAVPFQADSYGFDVMLAGTQKALALPPGATLFTVSERALAKAATVPDRGYYFDFVEFQKNHEGSMTPSTPSLGHFYALQSKLAEIAAEGLDARFARHLKNAELVRAWAAERGFPLFPEKGYESVSLSCLRNDRNIDIPRWIALLKERHRAVIDGGYGKLKGKAFRISHMGDETPETMGTLLGQLDDCLTALA